MGSGQQVKIRYEDQQKDCETTVNVKDVRPEESQRKKPAMCLMTRESNYSGRGGLAVAEKLLKAGLRDALGKASTGQGHGNVWGEGGNDDHIIFQRISQGFYHSFKGMVENFSRGDTFIIISYHRISKNGCFFFKRLFSLDPLKGGPKNP